MIAHSILWTSPAPLWPDAIDVAAGNAGPQNVASFLKPSILRFATDKFMDDYLAVLNSDPASLRKYVAQPETWSKPAVSPDAISPPPPFVKAALGKRPPILRTSNPQAPAALPLKLYQPMHMRYYMVTGSLVCQMPGLPNRTPVPGQQERTTFVVRRLSQETGGDEYAMVNKVWKKLSDPTQVAAGEEELPLPSSIYTDNDGHKRRIFAGLIPVGKREEYMGAQLDPPATGSTAPTPPPDIRVTLFQTKVIEPLKNLCILAQRTFNIGNVPATIAAAQDQIQEASWYILLDFVEYLQNYINPVWQALGNASQVLNSNELALVDYLKQPSYTDPTSGVTNSLWDALTVLLDPALQSKLENVTGHYSAGASTEADWPDLRFPFADASTGMPALTPRLGPSKLTDLINAALPQPATQQTPPTPIVVQPGADPHGINWFTIRLVFERPNCGPLTSDIVSDPSVPFQLAGFFDSDAPARPLLIPLPVDTTAAGLRKHDKNTGFVMSNILCGQMKSLEGLSLGDLIMSVLPFPLHKDLSPGPDTPCTGGQICSLSIPIVTICAFILLIMIVKLLDLIFNWMPFFRICLPIPGFDAKAES
jgi:hypothetical protein